MSYVNAYTFVYTSAFFVLQLKLLLYSCDCLRPVVWVRDRFLGDNIINMQIPLFSY